MAALPAFSLASIPLVFISIWHLICSTRSYLRSPALFYAKSWHPFSRVRHGELYMELLITASCTVYQAISVSSMNKGSTSQILGLQHLAVLVFFTISILLTLISEATFIFPLPQDANFVLLAMAFASQCFVLYRSNSDPQLALEQESFHILAAIAAFSAISCILLAWRPNSYLVSVAFSGSLFLQGTWLLQLGFSLYSERFLPEGCHRLSNGLTQCDVDVTKLRAVALMDLALIIHVFIAVLVFSLIFSIVSSRASVYGHSHRRTGSGYEHVDVNGDSEHLQMKPLSTKVVID